MRTRFTRRRSAALLAALCSSCEAPTPEDTFERLPIRYVTDELEIATSFDEPLCAGDLRWLDTHTRRVEDFLGVDGGPLRTLYIYGHDDIFHDDELLVPGCEPTLTGCFRRDKGVALGDPTALPHELVHAVSVEIGERAPRFWNEGLAEALSLHAIDYFASDLVMESKSDDFRYQVPGHFMRWLIEWHGIESFVRVFQGDAFANVYGMELEDVEQIYDAEAPEVLPSPFACDDEMTMPSEADGSFVLAAMLGCGEPSTTQIRYGFAPGLITTAWMIEVAEETTYSLRLEGGDRVYIGGCQAEPSERIDQLGDVLNETWLSPAIGLNYPTGTRVSINQEVFLPAWTYRVIVVAEDMGQTVDVHLRLTPQ